MYELADVVGGLPLLPEGEGTPEELRLLHELRRGHAAELLDLLVGERAAQEDPGRLDLHGEQLRPGAPFLHSHETASSPGSFPFSSSSGRPRRARYAFAARMPWARASALATFST